jgi:hypothetical protein
MFLNPEKVNQERGSESTPSVFSTSKAHQPQMVYPNNHLELLNKSLSSLEQVENCFNNEALVICIYDNIRR